MPDWPETRIDPRRNRECSSVVSQMRQNDEATKKGADRSFKGAWRGIRQGETALKPELARRSGEAGRAVKSVLIFALLA